MARSRKDPRLQPILQFSPYRWVSFKLGRKPRGRRLKEDERDVALKLSSENTRAKLDLAFRMASLYDAQVGDLCHSFEESITYPFPNRIGRRRRGGEEIDSESQNNRDEARSVSRVPLDCGIPEEELEPSGPQSFGARNSPPSTRDISSPPGSSASVASSEAALEQQKRESPLSSHEIVSAKRVRRMRNVLRSPAGSRESQESESPKESRTVLPSRAQEVLPGGESRLSDDGQSENGASRGLLVSESNPSGQGGEKAIEVQSALRRDIPPDDLRLESHASSASPEKSGFTSPGSTPSRPQGFVRRRVSGSATPCSSRHISGSPGSHALGELQPTPDDCSPSESVELGSPTSDAGPRARKVLGSESSDSSLNNSRDTAAVDDFRSSVEGSLQASLEVVPERRERDPTPGSSERHPSTPVPDSTGFSEASELEPLDLRTFAARLPKVRSLERHSNSSFDFAEVDDGAPSTGGSLEEPQRHRVIDQPDGNFLPDPPEPQRSTQASDSDLFSETLEPESLESRVFSPKLPGVESSELSLKSSRKLSDSTTSQDGTAGAVCKNTLEQPEQSSSRQSSEIITAMQVTYKRKSCALDNVESRSEAIARLPKFESPEEDLSSDKCRNTTPEQHEQSSSCRSSEIATAMQIAHRERSCALDDGESASEAIALPLEFDSPEKDSSPDIAFDQPEQDYTCPSPEIVSAVQVAHNERSYAHGDDESSSEACSEPRESEFAVQAGGTVEDSHSSGEEALGGESPSSDIGRFPDRENDPPRSQIDDDDITHRGETIESPEGSVSETMNQEVNETLSDDDAALLSETSANSPFNCAESTGSTSREHSPEAAASLLEIALDGRDERTMSRTELERDILESSSSSPGSTPKASPLEALVSDANNPSSEELSSFWLESARKEAMDSEAPDGS